MIILGVNAYHGDASAAVVVDGELIAAAEEERFNRIKHCAGFPSKAIEYCLKEAGVTFKDLDYIALPRDPMARILSKIYYGIKIPRLALRRFTALQKSQSIKQKIAKTFDVDERKTKAQVINVEHHRAHLASSFFVSPFDKAILFSADGLGDFASTMWGVGEGNKIKINGDISFPHSLGFFYTAITQYLGFMNFGDEYKVMGLGAYGAPKYEQEFKKIVSYRGKMRFKLGLEYFLHHKKLVEMNFEDGYPSLEALYSPALEKLLGRHRDKDEALLEKHKDIAATLQKALEDVLFALLNQLLKDPSALGLQDDSKLCLAGGVAFNCLANGKIFKRTPFKEVYIQSAAGDAGLAIGAAYYLWHQVLNNPRKFIMQHSYWGPGYDSVVIKQAIDAAASDLSALGFTVTKLEDEKELYRRAALEIANGKIMGWFQGRMEWGPRALGNRSIVVDPRRKDMKDILNARIKHRESFRPFAPSILEEKTGEYFEQSHPSPFMLFAYKVRPEKQEVIPAPTHVDGTGRLQTVNREANPRYWGLIKAFEDITGVPVLLNTSFNENEPVVNTPKEALDCFLRAKMDVLVLGDYIVATEKSSFCHPEDSRA